MTLDKERWLGGRYLLGECIASGGVGAVHRGRTREGGPVAIKCLRPDAASDPRLGQSLIDEARLSSRIRHPNVVELLDTIVEGGEVFLVMELVSGQSLWSLFRAGRIPVRIGAGIVAQALLGLHAAHETENDSGEPLDIVHRDVSPQNILLGNDGSVKVIDFGIAKATQRMQYTRTGEVKGKLGYLSFEQLSEMKLDRRTDVFAASVVLWELLAGERLFDGETEVEVIAQVLSAVPDAPSRKNPDVPPEIDAIVQRGLSRRAPDRFATALEMQQAIQASGHSADAAEIAAWLGSLRVSQVPAREQRKLRPSILLVVPVSLLFIVLVALLWRYVMAR